MFTTMNFDTLDKVKLFEHESPLAALFRSDYFSESIAFFMEVFKNEAVNRCADLEFIEKLEIYLHDVDIYSGETLLQKVNNCIDEWKEKKCIELETDDNTKKHYILLNSHIRQFIASFYKYNSVYYSNAETSMARIDILLDNIVLDMEEDQEIRKANEIKKLEDEILQRQKEIDRLKDPSNIVEAKKDVIDNFNEIRSISNNLNSLYTVQKKGIRNIIKTINTELHKNDRSAYVIFKEAFEKAEEARSQNGFLQAYQNMQSYTEEARMNLFKNRCKKIVNHPKIVELLQSEGIHPQDFELFASIGATIRSLIASDEYLNKEFDRIISDIESGKEAKIQALYALHLPFLKVCLKQPNLFDIVFNEIVIASSCPNEFTIRENQTNLEKVKPTPISKDELDKVIQKEKENNTTKLNQALLIKHINILAKKYHEISMKDIIGQNTKHGFAEYKMVETYLNKKAKQIPTNEYCDFYWNVSEFVRKKVTLPNLRWSVKND